MLQACALDAFSPSALSARRSAVALTTIAARTDESLVAALGAHEAPAFASVHRKLDGVPRRMRACLRSQVHNSPRARGPEVASFAALTFFACCNDRSGRSLEANSRLHENDVDAFGVAVIGPAVAVRGQRDESRAKLSRWPGAMYGLT